MNNENQFRNVEALCPKCSKITRTKVEEQDEEITIGRYNMGIPLFHGTCENCGSEVEHQLLDFLNAQRTSEYYRKEAGLISNEKIHRILETLNLSTTELSEKAGFPVNRVGKFLYSNINPNAEDSEALMKIYNEENIGSHYND